MFEFEVSASSAAAPEDLWAILVDSVGWPAWTGLPKPTMEAVGTPAPNGLGAVRRFSWGPMFAREEVVHWDPPRRYAYSVIGGMPIRGYTATVCLTPTAAGTDICWSGRFDGTWIPGLARPLRRFTRRQLGRYAENLARLAEGESLGADQ